MMATVTATRRATRPKKGADPKRWIIDGVTYREEDLPAGFKHPRPDRDPKQKGSISPCPELDLALLASIKTPHMINHSTGRADLADGIPLAEILSFTDRGIVLRSMYGVQTKIPVLSREKDPWGDAKKEWETAVVGSAQKIYYRDVVIFQDPDRPTERTLQTPGGMLVTPMWGDWRGSEGIPVGREPDFVDRLTRGRRFSKLKGKKRR